ncbi:serine hydrolase domain-containing protein [Paenibacillus sp. MBLB4367]|uniref:serine hydrolase domain-containing protein n=1 Tax=Paenibacillus sp. MBLB4367 TaxID=3384767 RepID=UPI0039080C34
MYVREEPKKRGRIAAYAVIVLVCVGVIALYLNTTVMAKKPDYWPTAGWKTAAPEEQGMDSANLAAMFDQLKDQNVHSLLIARNGYIVTEAYNSTTEADQKQDVLSVTKSVMSSLMGIAINQGKIGSVDESVSSYLPELTIDSDTRKQSIMLKSLMTMTSGLTWNNEDERSSKEMIASPNWIQYIEAQALEANPGTKFAYSNGNAHLLSPILQKATGKNAADYAKEVLFQPLGITDVNWTNDPQDIPNGAWGLQMTLRDMAKFGYLFQNNGKWEGSTVVPKEWVEKSTSEFVGEGFKDGTKRGYGFMWWLRNKGNAAPADKKYEMYSAVGSGGQRIVVVPEQKLVIAFTADNSDSFFADKLIDEYIVPSVQSAKALPANEQANAQLQDQIAQFKQTSDVAKQ